MFTLKSLYTLFYGGDEKSPSIIQVPLLIDIPKKDCPFQFFWGVKEKDFSPHMSSTKGLLSSSFYADFIPSSWSIFWRGKQYKDSCHNTHRKNYMTMFLSNPQILQEVETRSFSLYEDKLNNQACDVAIAAYKEILSHDFFTSNTLACKQTKDKLYEYIGNNIHRCIAVMVIHGFLLNGEYTFWQSFLGISSQTTISDEDYASKNNPSLAFSLYSYLEIAKKGLLTAKKVAENLVTNDKQLFGENVKGVISPINDSIEKDSDYWVEHMNQHPSHWCMLINNSNNEIVGNYSFVGISHKIIQEIIDTSTYNADFFKVEHSRSLGPGTEDIFLLNLSCNINYQDYYPALWKHFFNLLADAAEKNDCRIRNIYTVLFRNDLIGRYRELGFRKVPNVVFEGGVKLYRLDLSKAFKPLLISHANRLHHLYKSVPSDEFSFRTLTVNDTSKKTLYEISKLIWQTDQYIYEESIMSITNATKVLPLIFKDNHDSMFNLKNLFVAFHKDKVVGIILALKSFHWNSTIIEIAMEMMGVNYNKDHLQRVSDEYFSKYSLESDDTLCILNFNIDPFYSQTKLCTEFFKAFTNQHKEKLMLYCLKETPDLLNLYAECGFQLTLAEPCDGFSLAQDTKLPCYKLTRPPIL